MSAQGGTLQRRGTIELPIWPVAVLVAAAVAAAVGMTLLRDAGQTRFVTSVTDSERLSNSTAAVREQGATLPATVGISHVAPSLHSVGYAGFENPGAYVIPAPAYAGFENPGAYPAELGAPAEGPIIVNGEPCMQCR
jgi:hypothetical protein